MMANLRSSLRCVFGLTLLVACDVDGAEPTANTFAPTSASASATASGTDDGSGTADVGGETDSATSSANTSGDGGSSTSEVTTATTMPPPECNAGQTPCGVLCVDTQVDPGNCGGCGVSCVVPNAEAMCVAGNCAMGDCDAGWGDCDGLPGNGCEATLDCNAGASCTTSCGSQGVTACNGCEPVCMAQAETCNAADDDCNGQCDEGAIGGCRESVHRANGPNGHYYTNVLAETTTEGRHLESADYWWLYTEEHPGTRALYRCEIGAGSGRYFLTASSTCEGAGPVDDVLGYMATAQTCGATALYRLQNGRHFYTTSAVERDNAVNNLGYTSEGITGYVWGAP